MPGLQEVLEINDEEREKDTHPDIEDIAEPAEVVGNGLDCVEVLRQTLELQDLVVLVHLPESLVLLLAMCVCVCVCMCVKGKAWALAARAQW